MLHAPVEDAFHAPLCECNEAAGPRRSRPSHSLVARARARGEGADPGVAKPSPPTGERENNGGSGVRARGKAGLTCGPTSCSCRPSMISSSSASLRTRWPARENRSRSSRCFFSSGNCFSKNSRCFWSLALRGETAARRPVAAAALRCGETRDDYGRRQHESGREVPRLSRLQLPTFDEASKYAF